MGATMATQTTLKKQSAARELSADAARSKADIIAVATEEFAQNGLSGARVDAIAERTRTSKRMIYYYFTSKEGLYSAVLESSYDSVRSHDSDEVLESLSPPEAIRRMVEVTFDYDDSHPMWVRLVTIENIHHAAKLSQMSVVAERNKIVLRVLDRILKRGHQQKQFRGDVSAVDVHALISAVCFFRVANRHTFKAVFGCDTAEPAVRKRHRKMAVEAVLRYLAPG
jgi:AcrR family transcriptional regulator